MILPFVLLTTLAFAACNITIQEDVIFLLDYSSSVHPDDFEEQKQFAARMVRQYLPNNTRVACVGFGTFPTVYFGLDEFSEQNFDRHAIAQGIEERAIHQGGRTYLQRALEEVVHNVIDATSPRRKLLVLITDGAPSDYPCLFAPVLERAGVKTIVVGITVAFFAAFVECLVQSKEDIMQVDNFDDFARLEPQLGDLICSTDYDLEITEIKAGGSDRFVEIVNKGGVVQTSDLVLYSNLLISSPYRFPESFLPTGGRLMLSESSIASCLDADNCLRFATDFVSNSSWFILLRQEFLREAEEIEHDLVAISFDGLSEPKPVVSEEYSIELIEGYDINLGSSWRRACVLGGSPGLANNETCHVPCDLNSDDCGSLNTCTVNGCQCANIGFLESKSACQEIPPPKACMISGFIDDIADCRPSQAKITWEASDASWVVGYRLTWGSSYDTNIWQGLYETMMLWDHCDWNTFGVSAIAEFDSYQSGNRTEYTPRRWSVQKDCDVNITTTTPTASPSTIYPSVAPSLHPSVSPSANPSFIPSDSPSTTIPSTYPSLAPSIHPSANPTPMPSVIPTRYPSGVPSVTPSCSPTLHPISGSPSFSPSTFPSYLPSVAPSKAPITEDPTVCPSLAPRWDHPEVAIGGLNWFKVGGIYHFNSTEIFSNQRIKVDVRIFQSPDYLTVSIYWGFYEITGVNGSSTIKLIRSDSYTFPEGATLRATDLVEIDVGLVDMGTEDHKTFEFRVLSTNETDRFGRLKYRVGYPSVSIIHVNRYVENSNLIKSDGDSVQILPLWTIATILTGSLCICCFACCCVAKQHKLRRKAERNMKEVEEDLRREQDGFFHDLPDHQVHDNPMASRFSLIGGSQSPEFVEKRSSIVITEDIELIKMQSAEYEPEAVRDRSPVKPVRVTRSKSDTSDYRWTETDVRTTHSRSSVKPYRKIRRIKSTTTDYGYDVSESRQRQSVERRPQSAERRRPERTRRHSTERMVFSALKPDPIVRRYSDSSLVNRHTILNQRDPDSPTSDGLYSPDSDGLYNPVPISTERPPLDSDIGGSSFEEKLDDILSVNPASFASTVYALRRMSLDGRLSLAGTLYEADMSDDETELEDMSIPPLPQRSMSENDMFLTDSDGDPFKFRL